MGVGTGLWSGRTSHTVTVGVPALRKVPADTVANHAYTVIATVCRWEDDRVGSRAIGQPAHEADVKAQLWGREGMLRPKPNSMGFHGLSSYPSPGHLLGSRELRE